MTAKGGWRLSILLLVLALPEAFGVVAASIKGGAAWFSKEAHLPASVRLDERQLRAALRAAEARARDSARTAGRSGADLAGDALAGSIRYSRSQARSGTVRRMPAGLVARLDPYFPADTLERVRWSVAGRRAPSLGTVLAGWYFREGAVTLDDTIVFSSERAAEGLELWSHELTHVRQYEELGVRKFARLYVLNWPVLERQAYANASRIAALEGDRSRTRQQPASR